MAITLYDATVLNFIQTVGAVSGFLDRGLAHFKETGINPDEIVEARLAPDMLPLRFQIVSVVHHSVGAIEGASKGHCAPFPGPASASYADLQAMLKAAQDALAATTAASVNGLESKEVVFQVGERRLPFVAENFLLSFSLPNFYFHATTAYDILRSKGVPLGKRDFLGRPRVKA